MNSHLVISIRFLGDRYHGRTENGREPEWPPSPHRLFQAILAGSAPRWWDADVRDREVAALQWFQGLAPPRIVAPPAQSGRPLLNYVRENLSDVAPDKRDMKVARPSVIRGLPLLRYSWAFQSTEQNFAEVIAQCARHCHSLGWGIDLVVGQGRVVEAEPLMDDPELWLPEVSPTEGATILRVPCLAGEEASVDTLSDLLVRYRHSLNRIADARNHVPPVAGFRLVSYRRRTDLAPRPFAAFSLLTPDAEQTAAFDKLCGTRDVAAMVRHLLGTEGERFGLDADARRAFVNGHQDSATPLRGEDADRRLMFLPLPTINHALGRVESIRRLLVVGPPGEKARIDDLGRRLCGEVLEHNDQPRALLTVLPKSDWVLRQYTGESDVWSTVVPAVFPGHHKGDLDKGSEFARAMFKHAGLPEPAELWWRPVGFRAGAELANRYERPTHMNGSIYHLRVRFPRMVRGPLAVGAGRYRGFGLMAVDS